MSEKSNTTLSPYENDVSHSIELLKDFGEKTSEFILKCDWTTPYHPDKTDRLGEFSYKWKDIHPFKDDGLAKARTGLVEAAYAFCLAHSTKTALLIGSNKMRCIPAEKIGTDEYRADASELTALAKNVEAEYQTFKAAAIYFARA